MPAFVLFMTARCGEFNYLADTRNPEMKTSSGYLKSEACPLLLDE